MVVRMRHTRGHTANRRSHHALTEPALGTCEKCGTAQLRHTMCANCGNYRGRAVRDMSTKQTKRMERIAAKKAALTGHTSSKKDKDDKEELSPKGDSIKPLNPTELSHK